MIYIPLTAVIAGIVLYYYCELRPAAQERKRQEIIANYECWKAVHVAQKGMK